MTTSRRQFVKTAGRAGLGLAGVTAAPRLLKAATARVVVIGGGAAGATVAKYLSRDAEGALQVQLVEARPRYTTCFYSNLYIGGYRTLESITHDYDRLRRRYGVEVITDQAVEIDPVGRQVRLAGGGVLAYDKLVVAPGIAIDDTAIEGYDQAAAEIMPHSWFNPAAQAETLRRQIEGMESGGLFILAAPPNPYRCPPGPYERVCAVAHQFRQRNPRAKILILDAKDKFSKQELFQAAWEDHYGGMVEWIPAAFGGQVVGVDPKTMAVRTADDSFNATVANIIPPQRAGSIAQRAGLADQSGWCPVVATSMESKLLPNIFVVGDATMAGDMPKSAYAANSQAKVCSMAIQAELLGLKRFPPRLRNTCWSTLAPDDAVKVGAHYDVENGEIVSVASFVSAADENALLRAQARTEADSWYDGICADIFA